MGGLRTKLDILRRSIELCNYDIIFLTESWLTDNFSPAELRFFNYDVYRCDRNLSTANKSRGGGVLILTNSNLLTRLIPINASNLSLEHVFVLMEHGGNSIILGCTYIPPSSHLDVYLEHCAVVEQLRIRFPLAHFILLGDYNLRSALWSVLDDVGMVVECPPGDTAAIHICEAFNGLSLRQMNTLPNDHGVFLDLLFSDISDILTHVAYDNLLDNNYHHNAFSFDVTLKKPLEFISEVVEFYDFAKCDGLLLTDYLSRVDWSTVCSHDDINVAVSCFNEILLGSISISTPFRTARVNIFPRWFSGDLRSLTFEKKKAHSKFKRTRLMADYQHFSFLRARCKFLSRKCYSNYLTKVSGQLKQNPRYFWRFSEESRKIKGFPKNMFLDHMSGSSTKEMADLFARSFSSVYCKSQLPIPEYSRNDNIDFSSCRFTEDEVLRELTCLPNKFSSGPDGIPPFIVKYCSSILARPLSLLFNKSMISGVFPSEWKKSFVIPIFKSGDRCNILNYRGVGIQSCIPKVLDKLVYQKLSFASKNFISPQQHGFMSGRSTVTNLLSYQHDIFSAFEGGHLVHSVYTDVAKAFDRVNILFLIAKLRSYGIGEEFLTWLGSCLQGRTQLVRVGSSISSPLDVLSGVGQGSHTGPLLFSLFFNDLPSVIKHSSILVFADDVKIYKAIRNPEDCLSLQSDLCRFFNWLEDNDMQLAVHKCAVMEFTRSKSSRDFSYQINSVRLPFVNNIKDLGIYLDKNLSFCYHIDKLALTCHRVLGYVWRNSKGLSSDAFCVLYKALVRSLLEYACIVWCPYYELHKHTLQRVQNKFRWYCNFRFSREPSLESLIDRRERHDHKFLNRLIEGKADCPKLLELVTFDCTRRLRHKKTFFVELCGKNYLHHAPINRMMRRENVL